MLHTKYVSCGPHGFREENFLSFSHYRSMGVQDPLGHGQFGPRGLIGRIYVGDHKTLLYTKYISCGPHVFREEDLSSSHYKFVLRFYSPFNPMGSCRVRSVYLTTHLLGRLSPLTG